MTFFIIFQFLYLNHSQLENKMNYYNINMILVISMVDLVGIDVHISKIFSLKSRLWRPLVAIKRIISWLNSAQ